MILGFPCIRFRKEPVIRACEVTEVDDLYISINRRLAECLFHPRNLGKKKSFRFSKHAYTNNRVQKISIQIVGRLIPLSLAVHYEIEREPDEEGLQDLPMAEEREARWVPGRMRE